jgi:hypothetical protein
MARVDLYEDEAGGLYLHSSGDAQAFAHVERDMSKLVANFEDMLAGVPDVWTLFEALAPEASMGADDPGLWTGVERVPIEKVVGHTALVASWFSDDMRVEVHGSRPGSLPPGPNARVMLERHQAP